MISIQKSLKTFILFCIFSSPCYAEWTRVAVNNNANWFIDESTLIVDGHIRRIWVMNDQLLEPNKDSSRSAKLLVNYDCQEKRSSFLQGFSYSGQLGAGSLVNSATYAESWKFAAPGTIHAKILEAACMLPSSK